MIFLLMAVTFLVFLWFSTRYCIGRFCKRIDHRKISWKIATNLLICFKKCSALHIKETLSMLFEIKMILRTLFQNASPSPAKCFFATKFVRRRENLFIREHTEDQSFEMSAFTLVSYGGHCTLIS